MDSGVRASQAAAFQLTPTRHRNPVVFNPEAYIVYEYQKGEKMDRYRNKDDTFAGSTGGSRARPRSSRPLPVPPDLPARLAPLPVCS